jgi:anti-sigma regulatory factor (Ser/Thr protein kinase)
MFCEHPKLNTSNVLSFKLLTSVGVTVNISELICNWLINKGFISKEHSTSLNLVLQEAYTNGIEHGNLELLSEWKDEVDSEGKDKFTVIKTLRLNDPHFSNRSIYVECAGSDLGISIKITDEGKGYNFKEFSNDSPTDAFYGRGMKIISTYSDSVKFLDDGRTIELKWKK